MDSTLKSKLADLRQRGVSAQLCDRFGAMIRDSEPAALAKIVPPRMAQSWGLPADETLDAFLHATRLGLFDMEWDLRCPSCTGPTQREAHLDLLRSNSSCPFCDVEFAGAFDRSVEATWRVHPEVRDLGELQFLDVLFRHFVPEPLTQLAAASQQSASADVELRPGNYVIAVPSHGSAAGFRVHGADGAADGELAIQWDGQRVERGPWERAAGGCRVRLDNTSAEPIEMRVVRVGDAPWVSGAELACCQSFRDMFSRELIRPEDDFAIRSMAIVFTDLKGSTALYERVGDSRAYSLVRDHFEVMVELVTRHRGAIVKTIGDAIMATFMSTRSALAFALEVHQAFDRFNADQAERPNIIVKLGIHRGPCIAVNLNDRIDYFGRTVNAAARIQGLSKGGDIILSRDCGDDPAVQELLAGSSWQPRSFFAQLRGIEGEAELVALEQKAE